MNLKKNFYPRRLNYNVTLKIKYSSTYCRNFFRSVLLTNKNFAVTQNKSYVFMLYEGILQANNLAK